MKILILMKIKKNWLNFFTLGELKEALCYVRDKSYEDCFVNLNRFSKFRTEQENEDIKKQILELQKDIKF